MKQESLKTISNVILVYFNGPNVPDTIPRPLALESNLPGYKLELVFIDDASKDRFLEILLNYESHLLKNIKIMKLTGNFGTMAVLQAGLTTATWDCMGVIAADLLSQVIPETDMSPSHALIFMNLWRSDKRRRLIIAW